jgi:hypothetical protein
MKLSSQFIVFALGLGAVLGIQVTTIGAAQANTPDLTVKAALEKAGLKYTVLDNGNFKVIMQYANGRRQTIIINSAVDQVTTSSIRRVYSFPVNARLDDRTMDYAFRNSETSTIGGWEVNSNSDLVLVAKVNANLSGTELRGVIEDVGVGADALEREMGLADEK